MDKLKQTFSRNKSEEPEETSATTGKLTGPGSHFRSAKQSSGPAPTSSGTEPQTTSTTSTTPGAPNPSTGEYGSGPETAGSTEQPSASVGETSTYSSTPLAGGDPTSSVVDPESSDPMTYQKPETAYVGEGNQSGVPPGAASLAATRAFSRSQGDEGMPGAYPTGDEPVSTIQPPGTDTSMAGPAATAATTGPAGATVSEPTNDTSATAPSTLTDTTSPGQRLPEYGQAEQSKGLDVAAGDQPRSGQSGMFGRALGAVGLGSLGGAAAAKAASSGDRDTAVADTPDQPTTTTGVSSSTAPEQSGPPPSHHRKESIPTTAYPAGPASPRPVAPPVGGTAAQGEARTTQPQEESSGRDAALGGGIAAAGAGAVGAGTYAMHGRGDRQDIGDQTSAGPAAGTAADIRSAQPSSAVPAGEPTKKSNTQNMPSTYFATTNALPEDHQHTHRSYVQPEEEDHTGRNLAAGTSGGVGAGAYAGHQNDQHQAEDEATRRAAQQQKEQQVQEVARQQEFEDQRRAQETQPQPDEEHHTGRNVAAGTAAGVGAGAAGAYAAHEYSQHQAEEQAASRAAQQQKEHAAQEAAQQRDFEEQQRAQQKAAADREKQQQKEMDRQEKERQKEIEKQERAAAKEEKHHQKELEKEEKHHQKEIEKEEERRQTEAAAAAKERERQEIMQRQRLEQEEEDRKRQKEAAAATGAGAAGAGAGAYALSKDDEPRTTTEPTRDTSDGGPVEKKPSLLKRMFKRSRKNKDTGEDEEYEEEGDDDSHTGAATAAGVGTAGAAGAGAAYYASRDDDKPSTTASTERAVDTTPAAATAHSTAEREPMPSTTAPMTTGHESTTAPDTTTEREPTTDLPNRDHHLEDSSSKPIEPVTGLPYDPSKDPEAAKRLEQRNYAGMDLMKDAEKVKADQGEDPTIKHGAGPEPHKKSLGEKIKEKLHMGGGVKEEDEKLREEGYKHHSEQPSHPTTTADPSDKSYEAQSGGAIKPSYNPFAKDDPSKHIGAE